MASMSPRTHKNNLLAANVKALQRAVRSAAGTRSREFRIEGVRGLVLNVLPSGTGTWYFHFDNAAGRRRKLRVGRFDSMSFADVRSKVEQLRVEVTQGKDPTSKRMPTATLTFRELASERFRHGEPLAPSTLYDYRLLLDADILPLIGNLAADAVTRQNVLEVVDRVVARGANRRADTARIIISSILGYGMDRGLVERNPADGLRNRHSYRPRDVVATTDQIRCLWSAMADGSAAMSDSVADIVRLALLTGQRRTEIAAISRSELDLSSSRPTLTIPRGRAKNRNLHRVPLSSMAVDILRAAVGASNDLVYVFPGGRPGQPIASRSVSKAMERTRERLGIGDITVHDLRRTVGTSLTRYGVPEDVLARVLNHGGRRSGNVTADVYDWYDYDAEKRAALELWADALEAIVDGIEREIDSYAVRLARYQRGRTVRVE